MALCKFITKKKRVRMHNFHLIKGNIFDITYTEQHKIKPKPAIPIDSAVIFSNDGCLIYRIVNEFWTCPLSSKERQLVRAVSNAKEQRLDGDEAHKLLGLK